MEWKKIFAKKEDENQELIKNGTVSIKNDEAAVTDPAGGGTHAKITVPEGEVEVRINGAKAIGESRVSEKDKIVITTKIVKEPRNEIETSVSADKMAVNLKKKIDMGIYKGVRDFEPAETVKIEFVDKKYAEAMDAKTVEEMIKEKNYCGTWDQPAVEEAAKALAAETSRTVIRGIPPAPGKPAFYTQTVVLGDLFFVEKNAEIGVLVPEIPPTEGKSVIGEPIVLPLKYELPKLGDGIAESQGKLTAAKSGRLHFDNKEIKIVPQLVVNRDLEEKDGRISFSEGDVMVKGGATERSFVHANGKVTVEGVANHSVILSDDQIEIKKSVSHCKIYVGWTVFCLKGFQRLFEETLCAVENGNEEEKMPPAVKPNELEGECLSFIPGYDKAELENLLSFWKKCEAWYNQESVKKQPSGEAMKTWKEAIKKELENINALLEKEIEKKYALNTANIDYSEIHCSGDIKIKGTVYRSNIRCEGKVAVSGYVNGGSVTAKEAVEVDRFESLDPSIGIEVREEKGYIKVRQRGAYTLLTVCDMENLNDDPETNVDYRPFDKAKRG